MAVTARAVSLCHGAGSKRQQMGRAACMETIMSKTNDISKLDHAKLKNRVLADSELALVSGGVTIKQKVVDCPPPPAR